MSEAKSNQSPKSNLWLELLLLSAASLFVELLVIRWMSADIRAFTIFRTFPLVTCFIGLGVGFARNNDRLFRFTPLAFFLFILAMKLADLFKVGYWRFPSAGVYQWQSATYWGSQGPYLALMIMLLFVLLAGPFFVCLCFGTRLATLFNQFPPLRAYGINLLGALAGSALFTVCAFSGLHPGLLLVLPVVTAAFYLFRAKQLDKLNAVSLVIMPLLALIPTSRMDLVSADVGPRIATTYYTQWSPYQRLDVSLYHIKPSSNFPDPRFFCLYLGANKAFYQRFFDDGIDTRDTPSFVSDTLSTLNAIYGLPDKLLAGSPKTDVLVVGSGAGMDVAEATKNTKGEFDAVEIDPFIVRLGKQFNPVYSRPDVHVFCDDARHFMSTTKRTYDCVLFGFLDSQTVAGQGSSVRLDAYVYTKESIEQAAKLLKPGGYIVLAFGIGRPSIGDRLYRTMESALGYAPAVLANTTSGGYYFVAGDAVRDRKLVIPAGWFARKFPQNPDAQARVVTDDWPYLYVDPDVIDVPYLTVIAETLLLSCLVSRKVLFGKSSPLDWLMFFLGAAFILLELEAIARLSLLYGSTWLTSAIVINSILVLILLANLIVAKWKQALTAKQPLVFVCLLCSLALSYSVAPEPLLASLGWLGYAAITLITLLPLCIAGLIFATSFAKAPVSSQAMTWNLLGAVVGGLLEYLSDFWGLQSLVLIAAVLYALAFLAHLLGRESHSASQAAG